MGRQIIKQPNGLLGYWSTITDDFLMNDVTVEDIIKYRVQEETERVTKEIREIMAKLDAGERPYYQFTMTWDETIAEIRRVHGSKKVTALMKYLADLEKQRSTKK